MNILFITGFLFSLLVEIKHNVAVCLESLKIIGDIVIVPVQFLQRIRTIYWKYLLSIMNPLV